MDDHEPRTGPDWEDDIWPEGIDRPEGIDLPEEETPREVIGGAWRDARGRFAMPDDRAFFTDGRRRVPDERMKRAARKFEMSLNRIKRARSLVEVVRGIPQLRARLDELEREVVAHARSWGWSWRAIACSLGLPHQTVYSRHADDIMKRRKRYVPSGSKVGNPGTTGNPYTAGNVYMVGHPYSAPDLYGAVDAYTLDDPYMGGSSER